MNIWDWIDYLARGLKKTADQSQQNYQQVHAYIDGHDKETLNRVRNIVNGKGYATTSSVQSLIDQRAGTIDKSIAKINSDIEQDRKDIASAQQANADTAKQLDTYSKQAQDQGKTIKSIQDKVDGFTATLADVQGNVTQVSDKVDGLSASLKDAQDNVASIKAQADQLSATLTDHAKSIATLTASAKELSSTLEDADGRLSKVEQTTQTNSSTLSDVQGDLSQVKQDATTLTATLKDAQGNISTLQQKADSVSAQLASAQGDIASLQTGVTGIKATLVSHEGDIHTLQADSKTLKDDMQDAQGDISTLKKTSTDVTSELKDHAGRISKTEQAASTLVNELADQQGHLNRVEQKAAGTEQTVANQQGQINTIETDAAGIHETLTGQDNQIANINMTLTGLNSKYEGVSGDLNNLKSQAQWATVTSAVDLNNVKTPCHEFLKGTVTNAPNESAWWYLTVEGSEGNRVTQTVIADQSNNRYTRRWADSWSAWVKDATQADVTTLSNRITTNSTQIMQNKQAIALKADQATVNNLSGEVSQNKAQLQIQAGQISSKVSSTDFKTLNDKVDGMKIGGRNLLLGTSTDEKSGKSYNFADYQIAGGLKPNTTYTLSGWARVDQKAIDNKQNVFVCAYTNDWSWSQWLNISSSLTAKYGKVTFTTPTGNNFAPHVTVCLQHPNNDNSKDSISGQGFISKLKLEEGNVSTDWTPAPEDLTTAIQKNSTAIDQTNQKISLKADQTEVDQIKNTVSQNSSQLGVMVNEIQSKVTSTDVNNIVDSKGYATTSTVQSLITQKAGTINESIVKLDQTVKQGAENNVQLVRKSDFADGKGSWTVQGIASATNPAPPAELGQTGMNVLQTNTRDAYEDGIWYSVKPGEKFDVDFWCAPSPMYASFFGLEFVDKDKKNPSWQGVSTKLHGPWEHITGTITAPANASFAMPWFNMDKPADNTDNSAWLAKPSIRRQNATTVAAIQQITASIDGLQSTVANKADKSQITQLSNMIQSKVSNSDFNDLKDKTTWKSADSIDLNTAVSQQKIFVKGGSNLPPGGYWWYVRVEPGYDSRIAQYATSDRDNKQYHRQYDGVNWSAWTQDASESEITQLRDDINLRVKSGDLLSQINIQAGRTLIQSQKIYMDANSVIMGPNTKAFIPSAAIENLEADKITTGTLNGIEIRQLETGGRSIDIKNGNIAITSQDPYEPRISFTNDGKNMKMFNALGDLEVINQEFALFNFTPEDTHSLNPISFFRVVNTGNTGSGYAHLYMDHAIIDGNEWWTPAGGITFGRTWDGTNTSSDYVDLYAKSFVPHSELSAKTRIQKLDRKEALDKIMQDDMYTYQFKEDVRDGVSKRYASFIIDNIHDVAQYTEPEEFLSANGKGRDDGTQLAYLIAAVQYQQEQIEELKKKLEEK